MRTGLILAGGDSSRFGSWKPLARFRGRPMVRWVADALLSECDELVVSVRSRDQAARLQDVLPEVRAVPDEHHDRGPIEGFARGFEAARGDIVLVAPCDAPLLRPALYRLLLEALESHDAAVPHLGVIDPLRAVYRTNAARRGLAERDPRCPASLVDALRPVLVEEDELRTADPTLVSFLDANREDDLLVAVRASTASVAARFGQGVKSPSGASLHTVGT